MKPKLSRTNLPILNYFDQMSIQKRHFLKKLKQPFQYQKTLF